MHRIICGRSMLLRYHMTNDKIIRQPHYHYTHSRWGSSQICTVVTMLDPMSARAGPTPLPWVIQIINKGVITILPRGKYANLDVSDGISCRAISTAVNSQNGKEVGLLQGHVYTNPAPGLILEENPMFFAILNKTMLSILPLALAFSPFRVQFNRVPHPLAPCVTVAITGYRWLSSTPPLKPRSHIPIKP